MRNLIMGGIGVVLGLIIVASSLIGLSGDAPKNDRDKSFRRGQQMALATGIALMLGGGLFVGGQLWYMRDDLLPPARRPRRRRGPERYRGAEPERDRPRAREADRDDRRSRAAEGDSNRMVVLLGIGGAVLAVLLLVGGGVVLVWNLRHPSSSASGASSGTTNAATTDPNDARALAANLSGNHAAAAAAMKALIALGPPAEPEVRKYLNHDDFTVRHRSAQVIEKIGTPASLPELQKVIDSGRSAGFTCENAVAAIKARERKARPGPRPTPPDPSDEAKRAAADLTGVHDVAAAAMEKLIQMGPAAEGAVLKYVNHDNFSARHRAAQVLEKIGTAASLDELQRVVDAKRSVLGAHEKAIDAIEEREKKAGGKS